MHSTGKTVQVEAGSPPSFRIAVDSGLLPEFYILFQKGILIDVAPGTSVGEFLEDGLGLDPDYIRTRISTIFLDGMPVDDVRSARLADGAVLALSAAMPGLVGATLRKGGILSPMRSAISYRDHESAGGPTVGRVRLKLFNMIMKEAGPGLLSKGIIVPLSEARAVLNTLPADAVYREDMKAWPAADTLIELVIEPLDGRAG
mgnify:CR=1 FL=1